MRRALEGLRQPFRNSTPSFAASFGRKQQLIGITAGITFRRCWCRISRAAQRRVTCGLVNRWASPPNPAMQAFSPRPGGPMQTVIGRYAGMTWPPGWDTRSCGCGCSMAAPLHPSRAGNPAGGPTHVLRQSLGKVCPARERCSWYVSPLGFAAVQVDRRQYLPTVGPPPGLAPPGGPHPLGTEPVDARPWLPWATVISRQASSGSSSPRCSMVRRCPGRSLGLRGRPNPGYSGLVQAGSKGQTVVPPGTSST